jgi:uncharacterized protein YndB with AHSA1/START domain
MKETVETETTAEVSKTIDATPAEVWKAITTTEKLKLFFMGADVESDWRVGSPVRVSGEYQGKAYNDKGEVLRADAPKRLSFSHWSSLSGDADAPENYHVVTFKLAEAGGGTKVTLSQSNLIGGAKPSDVSHRAQYEKTWASVLEGLAKLFSGDASSKSGGSKSDAKSKGAREMR